MRFSISFLDDEMAQLSYMGQPYASWSLGQIKFTWDIRLIALLRSHKPYLPLILLCLYTTSVSRRIFNWATSKKSSNFSGSSCFTLYSRFRGTEICFSISELGEIVVSKQFNDRLANVRAENEVLGAQKFCQFYRNPIEVNKIDANKIESNFVTLNRSFLSGEMLKILVENRPISGQVNGAKLLRSSFASDNASSSNLLVFFEEYFKYFDVDLSFQHGDLNPSNVSFDGTSFTFIDFEHFKEKGPFWLDYCRYIYSRLRFHERKSPRALFEVMRPWIQNLDCQFAFVFLMFEECMRREENSLSNEYEISVLQELCDEDHFINCVRVQS